MKAAREVVLDKEDGSERIYRITKVIGGRLREDFVGIELGPTMNEQAPNEERILPISYLLFNQSYRYKGYSVLVTERNRPPPLSKLIHLCWAELIRAGIGKSVSVRSARGNGPVHSDVQIEKPHLSGPIARRAGLGQMVVVVLAVS